MKNKVVFIAIFCSMVVVLLLASFVNTGMVKAAQLTGDTDASERVMQADATEKLELTCQYPVLSSYAGLNFGWDISLNYTGSGSKVFDLKATIPQGFRYTITPGYGSTGQEIAAIRLDGTKGYADSIKLSMSPYVWQVPPPGSYPVTFEVSSGDLKTRIELTAIVTVNYTMELSTPDGRLNLEATSGQDNNFTVVLTNTGTGDLEKVSIINMAKDRPAGWTITSVPEKIDSLKAGASKEIQINIRPSEKTIAGDYMTTIQAEPEQRNAFASLQIRVTVLTPTIWGWVGVGIVVLVIVALAVIFIRFGRR